MTDLDGVVIGGNGGPGCGVPVCRLKKIEECVGS